MEKSDFQFSKLDIFLGLKDLHRVSLIEFSPASPFVPLVYQKTVFSTPGSTLQAFPMIFFKNVQLQPFFGEAFICILGF